MTLEARLSAWLAEHEAFGPEAELVSFAPLSGGQSSELFRLVCRRRGAADEAFVVRREPRAKQLFLRPDIVRESGIIDGVGRAGTVPVAPLVAIEPRETVLDAPFLVMREVTGRAPLGRPSIHRTGLLPEISAAARARIGATAIATLARIHAIDWRTTHPFLGRELGGARGIDHHLAHLARWYAWSTRGRSFPLTDRALAYLHAARARLADDEDVLLWGDARPGNILFRADQSIAAVLDWEGALVGPRALDVGYWLMMDSFHAEMIGVERLPGWPSETETLAAYEAAAGVRVTDLDYFVVMGAFFIATTMIRAADIGVAAGRLAATTRLGHDNTVTQIIAHRLGLPVPELSPDFVAHRGLDPAGRYGV